MDGSYGQPPVAALSILAAQLVPRPGRAEMGAVEGAKPRGGEVGFGFSGGKFEKLGGRRIRRRDGIRAEVGELRA